MGRFRIYPSKNSVIFKNDTDRNVGTNEVFELWYGISGDTRAVFKWDWEPYYSEFTKGFAPALTASSVTSFGITLHTTYPILQSANTVGQAVYEMECPDNGDLIDFDEGLGYWHEGPNISTGYCNWNNATEAETWPTAGAAPNGTLTGITTVSRNASKMIFIPASMSLAAAKVWSGHIISDQYLITVCKYTNEYETLTGSSPTKKRLFYSRHTHTAFGPYCEVDWDDQIVEDRTNVIEGITSSLYLFVYSGGSLADPVSVDSVTILGTEYTSITQVNKGIYKYDYVLPAESGGTGTVISDVWNITYTGSLTGTISQTFTGVSISNSTLWSGDTQLAAQPYQVQIPNLDAAYSTGDTVYLRVKFRRQFDADFGLVKNAEYRVHIPNGATGEPALIMYDWSPISYRTNENFFIMNLNWFKTGYTYQIDIRYGDGHSRIVDITERKFKVTS